MLNESCINIVVGGTSSLGSNYIESLQKDASVIIATNNSQTPRKIINVEWIKCDIRLASDLDLLIERTIASELPVRLVWFPGVLNARAESKIRWDEAKAIFDTNCTSVTYFIASIASSLECGSRVCILSSISAINGSFDIYYAASKAALHGLVISTPRLNDNDVSIFGIAPSSVEDSSMFEGFPSHVQQSHRIRSRDKLLQRSLVTKSISGLMDMPRELTAGRIFPLGIGL